MKADHCGFQVRNLDKAVQFYTEKLGFTLNFRSVNQEEKEAYAFLSLGEVRLELIQDLVNDYTPPEAKKPFCPHFCIEVNDLDQCIEDLKAVDITMLRGPLKIDNEETWVYFSDLDNNVPEYIQ